MKGRGQFVFSACSHAGIVNVLTHARETVPVGAAARRDGRPAPVRASTEKIIPDTVADLKRFGLGVLAPGHCTGWRAMSALAREFGDELVPSAVGKRYLLS